LALGLALGALILGSFLTAARGAGSTKPADALRRQQSGLAARSQSALLGLYALDSRLAQARGQLGRLRARVDALRLEQQQVQSEAAIVSGNLRAAQLLLGTHLRRLYEEGEPNAMAILLGANSLDDAVTRLDDLERTAHQGAQAVSDARDGRAKLNRLDAALSSRVQEVQALELEAERTAATLVRARAERVAYLASLARQRRLTRREIVRLDTEAQHGAQRAQIVQSQTAPAAPVTTAPLAPGSTVTVSATGYSMPGRTATGLPVGFGIVAVDPSVIPLGTRMTIPGYGEGVAADTGSAVRGYTIDLWFPTLADALAWGRRTVTITLH
jgi:3D (Asp-Asp-Asp) domain-containing protein